MKKQLLIIPLLFILFIIPFVSAEEPHDFHADIPICGVYFTGVNCPHCEKAAPTIEEVLNNTPNLVLIKYEVQQNSQNMPYLNTYSTTYGTRPGFPMIIFNKDVIIRGDIPIIEGLEDAVNSMESNPCPLEDGSSVYYDELDCSTLPGLPEILIGQNKTQAGSNATCETPAKELTFATILGLAAVDAINPCAIAVLVFVLVAILTHDPTKKYKVLLAGLAFVGAIFVMYFVYGIIIVKLFQFSFIFNMTFWVTKALGVLAIILGLLGIRDFINYRPGRVGTEMPLLLRPKVKKIIEGVRSPKGAFVIGLLVTIFLLPCTIGPYFIAGGLLSALEFVKTLPWLALYNFIFVVPMIVITFIVFGGIASVEKVSGWKEKNIRLLHLIAGIIMLLIGIYLVLNGWVV
ncbi:MAG: hypothetical protein KKF46_05455 [Nanoarchaeota archaeon]|nr:hypothetical protein [Nanoarchaeota archaeon]MBU1321779.1 hypothetical protein [Nanoarchaeota archaeon]MBU1598478.1 hypothetical protein [Nanoarchaeota archaeon]MBU2440812.1 hypothetical protein [Nanoarchaeota archaeon]